MGIGTKLNLNILILLFIAFFCLLLMVNWEVRQNGVHLTDSLVDRVVEHGNENVESLTKNFQNIEKRFNVLTEKTKNIVTNLYITSYGTLTKSIINQIFPQVINFEMEEALQSIELLLQENPAICWVEFATSKTPGNDEVFAKGTRLTGTMQKIFTQTIQDDFNYLSLSLQVNLESMAAFSKIESMLEEINVQNHGVTTGIIDLQEEAVSQIRSFSSRLSQKAQKNLNLKLIVIMALTFAIVGIFMFFVARSIVKPILVSVAFAKQIAKGDFAQSIELTRTDEVGILIQSLNEMVAGLDKIFIGLKGEATLLSSSSQNLSSVSVNLSSVSEKTNTNAKELYYAAQTMGSNINNIETAVREAASNIDGIAGSTNDMDSAISASATASQDMRSISSQASERGKAVLQTTTSLREAAQSITRITESITEISESTNLLALNATIESARAGEAGKGFAVVAGEIKDLARQTAEATLEIKEQVDGIQISAGQALEEISGITGLIADVDERAVSVAQSMDAQSCKTREISDNISSVSVSIKEITDRISENTVLSGNITEESEALTQTSSITSRESRVVNKKSDELNTIASNLFKTVEQFQL